MIRVTSVVGPGDARATELTRPARAAAARSFALTTDTEAALTAAAPHS
eukprot:CAMPEP_0206038472 /NCGR_PEP_ID=MMETSP1466-20131121/4135_1 /ASSEMBLY_ACC=CAM_ASM_001126 /TAXON_ID=44452 /ORGANISM="Pavlova gyrans, Strain CCMP608" /LENGTH=47 /DNA_ID= /DNA_START= /DNA_END= /DNA_ORIENTATION=